MRTSRNEEEEETKLAPHYINAMLRTALIINENTPVERIFSCSVEGLLVLLLIEKCTLDEMNTKFDIN
jgi:hypothetical protein